MGTLFISDLHLEDSRPQMTQLLLRLLDGTAREADALYILGDLFEYWIGDDALSPTAETVAKGIRELVDSGVPCFFLHGNRDFLLGTDFARLSGFQLLPETLILDLYGTPTLLLHGDTLCTDDVEYQAFRKQVRDPAWQAAFLGQPVTERLRVAQQARDASKQHTSSASMEIMDVNPDTVVSTFHEHGIKRMIHGHTHRPAFHQHRLGEGDHGSRIVLADWYTKGSALEVTPDSATEMSIS
jgi:UDP-2,3-diacylglucosamine hydrolase